MFYYVTNVFLKYKSINYYFLNKKKKEELNFYKEYLFCTILYITIKSINKCLYHILNFYWKELYNK